MAEGWTMVTNFNLFFQTVFMAEMGPYLGDWPLMPPAILDSPGSYNWFLFMLALPNPGAPEDPGAVGDGSYPTGLYFARRDGLSAETGFEQSWTSAAGGGAQPSGAEAPPADYRLYVVADHPPDLAPAGYTPASYAAGGAAAAYTEAGGWSDWQPAFTVDRPALLCTAGGRLMDYPGTFPVAQFRHNATSSGVDGGNHHTNATIDDFTRSYPPPNVDVVDWAEDTGWPALLAALNDPAQQGALIGTGGWMFVEIFNQYTSFFVLSYFSITTWSWISVMQPRDGWQAQTNPVGSLESLSWVYGRDYGEPPFGVYPHYGGLVPPAHDLPGYGPMYGIGFPGYPDRFDHEAPKAIPEWVDVESYIVPNAYPTDPNPEVSIRNGGSNVAYEQHAELIDVFLGSPPLYTLVGGLEFSIESESDIPDNVVYRSENGWVDPVGSGMALIDQWQLSWTAEGSPDWNGDPGIGSIGTPRSVPLAFGQHVPYGTELVTVLMQAHSATSQIFNRSLASELPIPPDPALFESYSTGCQSAPVLIKNFDCYISDPYAPLRYGSPTMGVPTRMHEPRWRYWRPNKIVPAELSQIPMRLVQRGDGLGPSPATRLVAGHASASQQSPATRRLAGRNTFE